MERQKAVQIFISPSVKVAYRGSLFLSLSFFFYWSLHEIAEQSLLCCENITSKRRKNMYKMQGQKETRNLVM